MPETCAGGCGVVVVVEVEVGEEVVEEDVEEDVGEEDVAVEPVPVVVVAGVVVVVPQPARNIVIAAMTTARHFNEVLVIFLSSS
jgi:hypothetical protein